MQVLTLIPRVSVSVEVKERKRPVQTQTVFLAVDVVLVVLRDASHASCGQSNKSQSIKSSIRII